MKKLSILAIILLIGTFVSAQSINESFEGATFPPTGWSLLNPDGGTGWRQDTVGSNPITGWTGGVVTACTNGGTYMAFCTYITGGTTSDNQWLVTPQIVNVPTGYKLNFWMNKFGAYTDTVNVLVSTSGNAVANFTNLVASITYAATDSGWVNYNYDLSSYVGQSIYISFQEVVTDNYTNGAAIFLDNVQVAVDAAIPEISTKIYTNVYPTPAKDYLTIESNSRAQLVKIVNMIGQVVYERQYDSKKITLNTSNLKSGVYFLQIEYPEGTMSKKFVISE